ncbi:cellulose binding domain-containing protein [Micromonospora sp. DR5-3]|uniref:cellulose binding domain-containing protein n=1 Tax=unclassified Micromonospora TaxID=2617518 RepID=UPI0011D44CFA|nr:MULTISPECIES: cellulose binding domain-containing protein [unclassified Micromonospora]MCW3816122.1 cellulose binding domain-containing protein [Micromonospora sp. DR5-3]TYC22148.1 ATPase [Micromonospora sp. MP36]
MIEIGTEVDLFHPPARVWRALTDAAYLTKWFVEATPVADAPDRLLLRTAGLSGFDADVEATVVERQAPERLVLHCREGDRQTVLTCTVVPTSHGCRLSLHEMLEQGEWNDAQGDRRAEQHQQALAVRLPAILDWLAFQQVDLRRAEGGLTAELPVVRLLGDGRTRTRRLGAVLIGALAVLLLAVGAGVWATRRPTAELPDATPPSTPLVLPTATSAAPRPTPTRTATAGSRRSATPHPTPTARPSRTPGATAPSAPALTARYETVSDRLLGYRGAVTLTNPGSAAKEGWTVIVTLGARASIGNVNGAEASQNGKVVTFTGSAVPAGGSMTFRFDVRDPDASVTAPEGCTVDGEACAGL